MAYSQAAKLYLSNLITAVLDATEKAAFTNDHLIDKTEMELFEAAEHRPPSAGYHPIARERITASLLNDDDGQLWELSRMLRRVEWSILLRRFTVAVEEFDKIDKMWPQLRSSSPALWYLRAQMRVQQGFPADARECWKRAFECFVGYKKDWFVGCEESLTLRLLVNLIKERGNEKYEHSQNFEDLLLIEGYDSALRGMEARDFGYFYCDLYRMYLEYRRTFKSSIELPLPVRNSIEDEHLTRVIDIICHHIEAGHIYAASNLARYIYKTVGRSTTIHFLSDRFGKCLANSRNPELLFDFFVGQLYYHCARNLLKDCDSSKDVRKSSLQHCYGLLDQATHYAKACGDSVTVLDIEVMFYVIQKKIAIDTFFFKNTAKRSAEDLKYVNIRTIKQQFDKFLKEYSSRQDARRISSLIDRFHALFRITRVHAATGLLGHVSAQYQRATGDVRWSHPHWITAASSRRRGELLRALKGIDTHHERSPSMTFSEKHHLLKTRLEVCHMLGLLKEGIKTGKKLIIHCDKNKKMREGSEARYDYLLLKTDLMAVCIKEEHRRAYISKLLVEFKKAQDRDKGWMPTSTHAIMKALLLSAFLADNGDVDTVGFDEVRKSQTQFELLKANRIFKINMTSVEKEFMDFHHCYAQYVGGGERIQAFKYCEKMAFGYLLGRTHLGGMGVATEYRRRMLDFNHGRYWKATDDLYKSLTARGEQRSLARLFFEVGKFCGVRGRDQEALSFWIIALEHLSAVEKFGITNGKVHEYTPAVFRGFSFDQLFEYALPAQMRIDQENRMDLAMPGTFYWTQSKKAHEFRRIVGAGSIWEDWMLLFEEFETVCEYTSPPVDTEVFKLVKDGRAIFGPDGHSRTWSSDPISIEIAEREKLAKLKILMQQLEKTEVLRAPLSAFSASPPFTRDLWEIRRHRTSGQSIVYIDYVDVSGDVFMLYNVENKERKAFTKETDAYMEYGAIKVTTAETIKWTETLLARAMAGEDIQESLSIGARFVNALLKITVPGDMIVIGNSWFTARIPFHALQIGYDKNTGEIYTLMERNNIIYTPTLLALKHCMDRLTKFRARTQAKIPHGTVRVSVCAIPPAKATASAQSQLRDATDAVKRQWSAKSIAAFSGGDAPLAAVKDQLMRTTDFVHFLGEVGLHPAGNEPAMTRVKIGPHASLTAREIAREFRFYGGSSPCVCVLYVRAERKGEDVKGKGKGPALPPPTMANVPDGIPAAFIQAGAATVVSTLWPVPVKVAARFGELLHSDFQSVRRGRGQAEGRVWDVASAVHNAAWQLRCESGEKDPHWAAFVVNGAWVRGTGVGGRVVSEGKGMKTDKESYEQEARWTTV
ncbi:hypothetical protein ABW21_db0208724 [Orbilia brochopaga]|nr:hypothetical protein ABW21_db0208724 [Drechslerella brochopaga]